jgi:hypothetical protein
MAAPIVSNGASLELSAQSSSALCAEIRGREIVTALVHQAVDEAFGFEGEAGRSRHNPPAVKVPDRIETIPTDD